MKSMSNADNRSKLTSLSFLDILGLIFIVLKLTGFIDWSWWLVLLPLYIPLAVLVVVGVSWLITEVAKQGEKEKR